VPFPVYKDKDSTLAKQMGATAFPTFVLVDKFGHIRYTGMYPEQVVEWSKALVAETRDPGSQAALFGTKSIDAQKLLAAKLPYVGGKPMALSECMGQGGLMLLFVDTSCPFSATALKDMPSVSKVLAERKVNAIVVNNDDPREKVQAFYQKNDPGVRAFYDTSAATRQQWNVQSVPTVVYITPAGQVGYKGEAVWANVGTAIEKSMNLAAGTIKFTAAGTGFG
jgi:thioredoxin-related protein